MSRLREQFSEKEWNRLQHRADRVARAVDNTDTRVTVSGLVIQVGKEQYALLGDSIQAIHQDIRVMPLPNVPAHIAGLANIRGNLTTVLDMSAILNVTDTDDNHVSSSTTLVELVGNTLALSINQVITVREYFIDEVESLPKDIESVYAQGIFPDGAVLLDLEKITNDQRLIVDQRE